MQACYTTICGESEWNRFFLSIEIKLLLLHSAGIRHRLAGNRPKPQNVSMKERIPSFEIDLVYLWVDGSDPAWLSRKQLLTGIGSDQSETNNKGRYVNNDELKYSLRSVERYVPWVRKIFIVTDNQYPDWLERDHPKIRVVDHSEIMPAETLPCYNSSVIEYFLYRIPGLADRFLFANDDMFFNRPLTPDFFFDAQGAPYVRLKKKLLGRWHYPIKSLVRKRLGQYISMVVEGASLVEQKLGVYYAGIPHHNVDAYVTRDYRHIVEDVFQEQVTASLQSHTRQYGDLHRSAFSYYALATGKAVLQYVSRNESLRLNIYKQQFQKRLNRYAPHLFCLNDSQHVTDSDRIAIQPFLEELFPEKSTFEK